MKRVGLLVAGALVIVAVSRFTAVHPKAIGGPSRTAAPSVPRSSFATSVQDESRFPSRSLPAASKTVDPPDDAWRKRAYDYRERLLNLKPERTAEIEAVAPRMRLTPDTVERLSRWSDRAADLTARALSGIETKSQWELAMARVVSPFVWKFEDGAFSRVLSNPGTTPDRTGGMRLWRNVPGT
jgi:hypothetical protein